MTSVAVSAPLWPADRQARNRRKRRVLPGFNLTLGYTLFYLSLIVLIPLSALVFKTFTLSWDQFWAAVLGPRVLASYRLTFGASLFAAGICLPSGSNLTDSQIDRVISHLRRALAMSEDLRAPA